METEARPADGFTVGIDYASMRDWAEVTPVDDVEISPELLAEYIAQAGQRYVIRKLALENFRYALMKRALAAIGFDAPETSTIEEMFELFTDCYIRELAFQACVNLTANAIGKCEVKTFLGGQEVKDREYYLWNLSPNQNQSSAAFWHKLVDRLYRDRAALVVENGGKLYIADSWSRKKYALYADVFAQVTVGDFTFQRSFTASEVLFFELDANVAGDSRFKETFEEIRNSGFRRFAEAESAVLPMWKGMKYSALGSRTYNADTTRDIRAMIDDVTDFTARAYCIPPHLLNGSVQDVESAVGQFLTFCIDPLADSLQKEINRKMTKNYAAVEEALAALGKGEQI